MHSNSSPTPSGKNMCGMNPVFSAATRRTEKAQGEARNGRNPGNPDKCRHRPNGADGVPASSSGFRHGETPYALLGPHSASWMMTFSTPSGNTSRTFLQYSYLCYSRSWPCSGIPAGLDIAGLKIRIAGIWSTDPDENHASYFLFDSFPICDRAMPGQARSSHDIASPACAADWGHVCPFIGCCLV